MDLTFMNLVVLFSLGFVMCFIMLLSFIVGAYVVYRTKRDSHEPFFTFRAPEGDAGQAAGFYDHEAGDEDIPLGGNVDKILYGSPERRSQLIETLRAKEEENKDDRA
jgi:hypothetical protein